MDDNNINITVVVCTFNRCESLKITLDSLLEQNNDNITNSEIIVVDNNSKDNTRTIVESYFSAFKGRLRYTFEAKQGLSFARNRGIKEAKGKVIAFTDDDVVVAKDWILKINEEFNHKRDVDCILGCSFYVNESGEMCYFQNAKDDLLVGNGLNMSFKKSALEDVGFFDVNLGAGSVGRSADDMDIVYRFLTAGKKVVHSDEPKVYHMPRFSNTQRMQLLYRDAQGLYFFWVKHLITKRDIFALKQIYWRLSYFIREYFLTFKTKDKKRRSIKFVQIIGGFIGLLRGTIFYIPKTILGHNSINNNQLTKNMLKKIAYVHGNSNNLFGQEIVLLNIAKGINGYNLEPIVVLPEDGIFADALRNEGITVKLIKLSRFRKRNPLPFIITLIKLYNFIRREGIDIIHTSGLYPNQYCSIVAKLARIPCICHVHSTIYSKREIKNSLLKFSNLTIAVSNGVREKIAEAGIDEANIRLVYNGIQPFKYKIEEAKVAKIKDDFGLAKNYKIIGQIGQITERKGIIYFIRMAEIVVKHMQNVRFLLIGDDKYQPGYMEEMKELSNRLFLKDYIIFTGFRNDIPELITSLDVLTLSSLIEGFGIVLIEAMMLSKPVIATDIPGVNEVVENGTNGILVPARDYVAMANSALTLLTDKELAGRLINNAKKKVLTEFTLDKQISEITNIYETLSRKSRAQ